MIRTLCVALLFPALALAAAPPGDKPASPRSVPTDELPPFGMLDEQGKLIPLPTLPPAPPPGAVPAMRATPAAGPSMDLAIDGARAAIDACARRGERIAVAVVDSQGKPRALLMAEGSEGSVFVAMRKAVATLAYRVPSSDIAALLAKDPSRRALFTPVMFMSGGALPIHRGQDFIGVIASSGAHGAGPIGAQDEICARAGLAVITARLGAANR